MARERDFTAAQTIQYTCGIQYWLHIPLQLTLAMLKINAGLKGVEAHHAKL